MMDQKNETFQPTATATETNPGTGTNGMSNNPPSVPAPAAPNGSGASPDGSQPQTIDGASDAAVKQFEQATGKPISEPANGGGPAGTTGAIPIRPVAPPRFGPKGKKSNGTTAKETPTEPAFQIKPEEIDDLVAGIVGMLNDAGAGVIRSLAKKNGLEAGTATELSEAARMTPATEAMLKKGAAACARKYLLNFEFMPEAMVGIGLCVWGAGVWVQIKAIKDFKANQK